MPTPIELPKTYKACIYDNPGSISIKIVDLDMPEPGPGDVLVKLSYSGVCHSDLSLMKNSWPDLPYPTPAGQVGGHEGIGQIVKLGPGSDKLGAALGDYVGIKWVARACLSCPACLEGHEGVCFKQSISGYHHPGTFQQYVVAPANYLTHLPATPSNGPPPPSTAPLLCAGLTAYTALLRSGARPGSLVAVSGAGGGVGHLCVQIAARGMGLRVIGIDAAAKRAAVLEGGAEAFVELEGGAVVERVRAHAAATAGGGVAEAGAGSWGADAVRAVIVCAASDTAYAAGLDMVGRAGTVLCVGVPGGAGRPAAMAGAAPGQLIRGLKSVVPVVVGGRREAAEVLAMAARGGVVETRVRVVAMAALADVFGEMERGEVVGRVVVDLGRVE